MFRYPYLLFFSVYLVVYFFSEYVVVYYVYNGNRFDWCIQQTQHNNVCTYQVLLLIGVRDGGGGRGAGGQLPPPIRAVCRHEFGQRVDIIRAKHNRCLNNTNLGSVTAVDEKKGRI